MARVEIVTGGTRGIGEAISLHLHDAGMIVAANYAGNDERAKAFTDSSGIRSYKWDVADYDACHCGVEQVEALLIRLNERATLVREVRQLREEVRDRHRGRLMLGDSPAMQAALATIGRAAKANSTVLIHGESGTGKELVARALHEQSARAAGPFIKVNCAALTETLLTSELFGHEKGAFTGADEQRIGRFEAAHGGTILLDEISEISPELQAKMLRVLEEREIERVGGHKSIAVDVRILATTNRDLLAEAKRGRFREDLYYRLNVVRIKLPPLRDRPEDIPQIVDFCLQNLARQKKTRVAKVSPEAMAVLRRHPWPGNVRELENVIYRSAVIAQGDAILVKDLPAEIRESGDVKSLSPEAAAALPAASPGALGAAFDLIFDRLQSAEEPLLARVEQEMIARALRADGGDAARAAKRLGLSKAAVQKRLE